MDGSPDSQDAMIIPKVEEVMDAGLADWFKVDEKIPAFPPAHEADDDSATEDDSDHADVAPDTADEADPDDWFKVKPMNEGSTSTKPVSKLSNYLSCSACMSFLVQEQHDVKMGENEAAMEYDQEFIFKHLQVAVFQRLRNSLICSFRCFYLDSPMNAIQHGIAVKSKHENEIEQRFFPRQSTSADNNFLPFSFSQLSKLITDNGGKVVDLVEPKLTHVVVDKRDVSRRLELMKCTSKSVTFTPNLHNELTRNVKAQAALSCSI